MSVNPDTFSLFGGLDLVTPAVALKKGNVTAALNFESDPQGYARMEGYERFDGQPNPTAAADAIDRAARRTAIQAVPGAGPVRGVWAYKGSLWAFRDTVGGAGAMFKSGDTGWVQQTFGHTMHFNTGTVEFGEDRVVTGATSGATGTIRRAITQAGAYAPANDAAGYLVIESLSGTFTSGEIINATGGGSATVTTFIAVDLLAGGQYQFTNRNFYGSAALERMYFTNGGQTAFEWDGSTLAPIFTGMSGGSLSDPVYVVERDGDRITLRDGTGIVMRYDYDRPSYIAEFANSLWLGFKGGSALFSGPGEPLDYRVITNAGEIGVGQEITGFIANAATEFFILCRSKIDKLTGTGSADFVRATLTESAGAFPRTAQMVDEPLFLDDVGVRKMSAAQVTGGWIVGAVTDLVTPLMRKKLAVSAACSVVVKKKAQYRLFWDDGTGITIFFGREKPEVMPFRLGVEIYCASSGVLNDTEGNDRIFYGGEDGFVYEGDVGTSFDGAALPAYLQFAWMNQGGPRQNKRYYAGHFEIIAPQQFTLGTDYDTDYTRSHQIASPNVEWDVPMGNIIGSDILPFASVAWTQAVMGRVSMDLRGDGPNLAVTVVSEETTEESYILQTFTIDYEPLGMIRGDR